MNKNLIVKENALFFWMGAFPAPHNPPGFPDVYPFELILDEEFGLLSQKNSQRLEHLLRKTYEHGSTVGNAMDESSLGKAYSDDFLKFIQGSLSSGARILEIGAGRGYLAAQLRSLGFDVDALEPGELNKPYWEKYDVPVIQDMFPSPLAQGPYDAIIFYGVLEHISNVSEFLNQVHKHLTEGGSVFLSVPDCELEINEGDPSMLLHEHYHYFMADSLERMLAKNGFYGQIAKSGYGRCLYANVGYFSSPPYQVTNISLDEIHALKEYGARYHRRKEMIRTKLDQIPESQTIGIYCPARILALLPDKQVGRIRFFDDAPDLYKKYYPPFPLQIENRTDLLNNSPDHIWIMSQTFGEKIYKDLGAHNLSSKMALATEIFSSN